MIPDEFIHSFLRGVIDGDGCVYLNKNNNANVQVATASEGFANDLIVLFNKIGIVMRKTFVVSKETGNTYYTVITTMSDMVMLVRDILYTDNCLHLKRKKAKLDKFAEAYEIKKINKLAIYQKQKEDYKDAREKEKQQTFLWMEER